MVIDRACNAITFRTRKSSLTFWQRASAAVGHLEAYRHADGCCLSITLWGWMCCYQRKLPHRVSTHAYFRTWFNVYLPWANFNCGRR